ncbi:MAG: bacterial transcriptional activator domain-containing protein, partial [Chloroflexi bacterium]|nr:bacterial transcriptional activator domain-containing protein [Chloroflexota bacterium]
PYEDWAIVERERLRELYLNTRSHLAAYHAGLGHLDTAIGHYQTILARDPYREEAHRQLMAAYFQAGRRAEAVQQYQECQRILQHDLGVAPSPETAALYRRIAAGQGPDFHV